MSVTVHLVWGVPLGKLLKHQGSEWTLCGKGIDVQGEDPIKYPEVALPKNSGLTLYSAKGSYRDKSIHIVGKSLANVNGDQYLTRVSNLTTETQELFKTLGYEGEISLYMVYEESW